MLRRFVVSYQAELRLEDSWLKVVGAHLNKVPGVDLAVDFECL